MELILIILLLLLLLLIILYIYNVDSFKDINKYNVNYKEKYNIKEYTNKNSVELDSKYLINQIYLRGNPNFIKLTKINNLDKYSNFIVILDFPYFGGGTTFFINSILSKYSKNNTFLIIRSFDNNIHFYINDEYKLDKIFFDEDAIKLLHQNKFKIVKIFINSIIGHSKIFIDNLLLLNDNITSITHDYSLLYETWQPENFNEIYEKYKIINSNINIKLIKTLITQDINNLPIFDKYLEKGKDIIITPLPDFKDKLTRITSDNAKIVVGVLGHISNIKGRELIVELINNNMYDVYIFGNLFVDYDKQYSYNTVHELNELLIKFKPNIWIEATKWPETYSYCLTLSMITDLPILYLNKNFISVVENRLVGYPKAIEYYNIKQIIDNKLIEKHSQSYFYTISPIIFYNEFWESYFNKQPILSHNTTIETFENSNNKFDISTFIVYFPQYHEIPENNINFYDGFSDITNLNLLLNENPGISFETPLLNNMLEYDLVKNKSLIKNHIDTITKYNINGFAIYYYWFSENTITNKNMIMKDVIDIFFNIDINNRKVFFIWANEDWTKNPAFGNSHHRIENSYDKQNMINNVHNLIMYFKNDNYLKIDNKPVFLLHHPWFLNDSEIKLLNDILNAECINNNFDGVHFIVNSMNKYYDNYQNYNFHFNYKKSNDYFFVDNQKFIDYEKYINNINFRPNEIQTVVFDFDNRPRLFKPNRLQNSTICANNTEENQIKFLQNTINSYSNSSEPSSKILLINAWNEWGERMVIEPSKEKHDYYLNLIKNNLEK